MTLEGDGVLGADGRVQEGDGNSLSTGDTKGSTVTFLGEEMASDMEPAPIILLGVVEGDSDG